jgi:hypothetical protein
MPDSRRIVIDASVARSAGSGENANELSGPCRAVLNVVSDLHLVVFSLECSREWNRHQRDFARRWRRRMVARKRVVFLGETEDPSLREELTGSCNSANDKKAIRKDAHLIEAAFRTDRIVISRDDTVRTLFRRSCQTIRQVREVLWANPEVEEEQVASWLQDGARDEPARRLGHGG